MPNLLIRQARIVPVGLDVVAGPSPRPVDVAITDGRVSAVGPDLPLHADATYADVVDAEGRWLIPGLWDHHVHLGQWTLASQRLDLAGARSPEDVTDAVTRRLAQYPDYPVIGWGHRSGGWERDVTVSELDAVSGDTPVVLISGDGHHAWLNTVALLHLALPVRDSVVSEGEWFAAYGRLSTLVGDDGTSPEAYRRALDAAAAIGVVGLTDFEFSGGATEWLHRWENGCDRLRIRMSTYAEGLDEVLALGLRTGDVLPGVADVTGPGDRRLTMGPLKIISDGSLNTRTAWCCEPYADAHRLEYPAGQPNLTGGELRELLQRAHAAGLEVATHAIGDAAAAAALSAYASTGARGSIEHAQMLNRADSVRMAQLGVRASVQPAHLLDDRDLTEKIWQERSARCFAYRWMLNDGVEVVLGSDAPVSPLDPWLAIAAAVHRSADEREAWHGEQALSVTEALATSTDGWGTVAPGHPGDLVLLDADPYAQLDSSAEQGAWLRSMPVAATYVDGRAVHGEGVSLG